MDLPPVPPSQCRDSSTFSPPPLDGSLTLPELYDWHWFNSPKHPLFVHASNATDKTEIAWKEGVEGIHRAARFVTASVNQDAHDEPLTTPPVVAIFAASDTITYICTMLGVMRAGFTAFLLSPRLPAPALAHLLTLVNVSHILVGAEPELQEVASTAKKHVQDKQPWREISVAPVPTFQEIFPNDPGDFEPLAPRKFGIDTPIVIVHSSGTTSFPKPVTWTHRMMVQQTRIFWHGERDMTGEILACHPVPSFGAAGVMQSVTAPSCGVVVATYKPAFPATAPTPDNVFEGFLNTSSTFGFVAPIFLEIWMRDPAKLAVLKSFKGLLYSGGPLNTDVGNKLAEHGLNIVSIYGSSENGVMNHVFPESPGMDWEYIKLSPHTNGVFSPDASGASELILKSCLTHTPAALNTNVNGIPAYATSDLFVPHPSKPDLWKLVGRSDDQITLSTGFKANPGPLESMLAQDPHVHSAVIFGRGRPLIGVIIDPAKGHSFDPTDEDMLENFRTAIWPTIERMNTLVPVQSRLAKEMILVVSPSKQFTYTPKGSPRRRTVYEDYEGELDMLYTNHVEIF